MSKRSAKMRAAISVDELNIDAHSVPTTLHRAFEDITHIQLTADPFHVERLALVGESRVARDHERTGDPRQIRRKTFGDTIDEYSCSGSPPKLAKGRTTMERRGAEDDAEVSGNAAAGFACTGRPTSSE